MDEDGFDAFYTTTHRRLLGLLVLVTGDAAEAEDMVQEAFVRASARWRQLREHPAPEAWVRRVALNLAADRGRRARRRMAALVRHGPPQPVPELSADAVDLVTALRSIPVRQRQALVLHHVAGLPVAEVAAQLGAPAGTVRTWLSRGRDTLARRLSVETEERVLSDG